MTDEQIAEQFHAVTLRLERLDTKLDQLEKRLSDGVALVNTRLEGFENRLARKADTWVVTTRIHGWSLRGSEASASC